jgi:hypothetical protein
VDTTREGRHVTRLAELSLNALGKVAVKTLFLWDQGFRTAP